MMTVVSAVLQSLAIASKPLYYHEQLVDHFSTSDATFTQRYYQNDTAFQGPGFPILLIVGGEGAIPPSMGLFYPYVVDVLAPMMGALVLEPEHRFYGESRPSTTSLTLLSPQQALADTVRLVRTIQAARNCSTQRQSTRYCPVFCMGGSYPGFLSAMLRLRYPAVFDGAYVRQPLSIPQSPGATAALGLPIAPCSPRRRRIDTLLGRRLRLQSESMRSKCSSTPTTRS